MQTIFWSSPMPTDEYVMHFIDWVPPKENKRVATKKLFLLDKIHKGGFVFPFVCMIVRVVAWRSIFCMPRTWGNLRSRQTSADRQDCRSPPDPLSSHESSKRPFNSTPEPKTLKLLFFFNGPKIDPALTEAVSGKWSQSDCSRLIHSSAAAATQDRPQAKYSNCWVHVCGHGSRA